MRRAEARGHRAPATRLLEGDPVICIGLAVAIVPAIVMAIGAVLSTSWILKSKLFTTAE